MVGLEAAYRRMWTDKCCVYIYKKQMDAETKLTSHAEALHLEDVPCKLSFSTLSAAGEGEAATVSQAVKLFLAVDLDIPPGSKIVVTRPTGHVLSYQASGVPGYFPYHQEINLTLFEGWA